MKGRVFVFLVEIICLFLQVKLTEGVTYTNWFAAKARSVTQSSSDPINGYSWSSPDAPWKRPDGNTDISGFMTSQSYIYTTPNNEDESYVLITKNFELDLVQGLRMLPNDASITGMSVYLEIGTNSQGSGTMRRYCMIRNNAFVGTQYNPDTPYSGGRSGKTLQSGTDTWGCPTCMTAAQFKSSSSGLGFLIQHTSWSDTTYLYTFYQLVWFTFNSDVSYIVPTQSSPGVNGGEVVTIFMNGRLLQVGLTNNIQCRFGSVLGTLPTGVSAFSSPTDSTQWMKCVAPPQSALGAYTVSITLDGNTWTTNNVQYTYVGVTVIQCNPACVHGTCNTQQGVCVCDAGWTGSTCATAICNSVNNCTGRGTCNTPNVCTCSAGWSGTTCSTPVCSQGCVNGNCVAPGNCSCSSGWSGTSCSTPICSVGCGTNRVCVSPNTCACAQGWSGTNCDIQSNATCPARNNCTSRGVCVQQNVCRCNSGWLGANCSQPDCNSLNNCTSNGVCVNPNQCSCSPGWSGSMCDTFECDSSVNFCNSVASGGSCIGPNTCNCSSDWTGFNCSIPVCIGCQGNCTAPGICVCGDGLIPPTCLPPPPPSCIGANNCSGHGICYGADICVCSPGWEGYACDVPRCVVNQCKNGTCVNPEVCSCFEGYFGIECELENQAVQPPNPIGKSTIGLILGILFGLLALLLLVVLVFIYVKKNSSRRRKPKAVVPKYQALIFGDYLTKQIYFPPQNKDKVGSFENLLFENNCAFLQSVLPIIPVSETDEFAKCTMFLAESRGSSLDVLQTFAVQEISESESVSTLFRANSFCTKAFKFYAKMFGLPYIFQVLADSLVSLEHKTKEEAQTLEVDPNKVEEGEDTSSNRWELLLITQKIFTSISRSVNSIPPNLRSFSSFIVTKVAEKHPSHEFKALGSFWFLRFFCPALVAPHTYGLLQTPPSSALQRELVLLSKILQNLANGIEFGNKEPGMERLNEFINDNKNSLEKFYKELTSQSKGNESILIPQKVKDNSLNKLYAACLENVTENKGIPEDLLAKFNNVKSELGQITTN